MLALAPTVRTFSLFLHVLAVSVWVGGQIVVAGIVPSLRRTHPEATKVVAQAFGRVAWPAFAVIVVTGIWNMMDVDNTDTAYTAQLFVKILLAVLSAAMAAVHQVGKSKAALAVGGALGLLFALAAMFTGFILTTGA